MKVEFSPPDITEEEIYKVSQVLKSGWITTGPKTKEFEQKIAKYCNVNRAVCLNSATACLEMALRLLNIGVGDEVITTAYTYTATASVVCHVGAKLVLVDVEKDTYEMNLEQLEEKINENTKAIISVDIGGVPCDYSKLYEVALSKKQLFRPCGKYQQSLNRVAIIADGAHSFGASRCGKMSGEIADFTSFSFHAVKNLTTAEGGALTWRTIKGIEDEEIYKRCMLMSLHGQSKDALAKTRLGAWEYDVVAPYYKCNMTDIMAALGLVQLERYKELWKRRKVIVQKYDEAFEKLPVKTLEHFSKGISSSCHLYLMRLEGKTREETNIFIERMAAEGVATNVHYKPLPMLTAYKNMGFKIDNFPNAYKMFVNEVTLPLHTKLTDNQIEYVIDSVKKCLMK